MKKTVTLTVAQAIIQYLDQQSVERDGEINKFFAGCFGIFGHGNVGGIGQALSEYPNFRYYQSRNEQAMVHAAAAYARMKNRMETFACTASIGPGATNMLTAAASATINRLPVLLLPGDTFATRHVDPALQQLESFHSADLSVNDCFRPVSRFWDRITRPEQVIASLPQVLRVLTSPAETGAVTLCLPQDVQTESFAFPIELFEPKTWFIARPLPDTTLLDRAVAKIRTARKPLIVAGGGVLYSEASAALQRFVDQTGIPVAETFAGKGALRYDHPQALGAAGATGTEGANVYAAEADLVIGIGTRYSDFTTASNTAFQNDAVTFININITAFDAYKQSALPLVGDARATLEALLLRLEGYQVDADYRARAQFFNEQWDQRVTAAYTPLAADSLSQAEIIGLVNEYAAPEDVVLCAAGSLPGDLHKLWRTRDPKGFHVEYGYSCMGYEIAGGLGAKMATPSREVYVMVGDASFLMLSADIITSIQEGYKLIIILINNHGYASIGGLSRSLGMEGFGTQYRARNNESGQLDGGLLPVNLAENARSLGAIVLEAHRPDDFAEALQVAKTTDSTTVIYVETAGERKMAGYGHAWWEVPIASVAYNAKVCEAYQKNSEQKERQRYHL
ncbi:3D-(3,5/4)-trihydroxycyclohexane-1,2-dione acylhydrolase (decyclizing) [Sphingobacterium sp. lm-10]|uniref:3D-(3,5/4)-trihydroxycyclohexane-1,2-dione acylhydrolase (decyclizing) n=1 Tax=Sphingobacterium sp. lm-10 TaxID=2944904 RepID=UPI0020219147|nr:3D-(3,5/4)-trihydroxycyclohexane-1,2-dione acylhydrolase (decyclizing) [Sphingobacterium sp. lm-10]MCL7986367.1 3D-(3,5/4)-trihydroxycyclohexane-1,2-dione acylhydrolase (decyclizing) [Sphingobacterium sp. lm-10]